MKTRLQTAAADYDFALLMSKRDNYIYVPIGFTVFWGGVAALIGYAVWQIATRLSIETVFLLLTCGQLLYQGFDVRKALTAFRSLRGDK